MRKKVVVIGGGTGTYTLLRGLRHYVDTLDITAIVTMADSGGSTGRLRDEFGQLPVGDVRQALAALSADIPGTPNLLRDLFLYRFSQGEGLEGHNFGNLLLTALTDILGSEVLAIEGASQLLRIYGSVVPVTTDNVHLVAVYDSGRRVVGEHAIDEPTYEYRHERILELGLTPSATVSTAAQTAIEQADYIIFGPGDFYTSILANCVVDGMPACIQKSLAKRIFVANLMARPGQTLGMQLADYLRELERYLGVLPQVVLVPNEALPADLVARYGEEKDVHPVVYDVGPYTDVQIIEAPIVSHGTPVTMLGDTVTRSFIRHDSDALALALLPLLHTQLSV